jgi:hypothetical protein
MSPTRSGPGGEREVGFYEIRLRGHLGQRWATRLDVVSLSHESDGTTALRTAVVDQAALHGLLHKIRDLGLPLISVVPVERVDMTDAQIDPNSPATCSLKGRPK